MSDLLWVIGGMAYLGMCFGVGCGAWKIQRKAEAHPGQCVATFAIYALFAPAIMAAMLTLDYWEIP